MAPKVKTIGSSGQISFGKQHARRTVTVEQLEDGVWLVKAARVIPENELWLHTPRAAETLTRAVKWASENASKASAINERAAKLRKRL